MARVVRREAVLRGEVEPCINGGTLALGAYLRAASESLAAVSSGSSWRTAVGTATRRRARARRTTPPCACSRGCSSTSVPSGSSPAIAAARRRGEEYLLERNLFRRRSTGEVASPEFLTFAFPPRYEYDVLVRSTTSGPPVRARRAHGRSGGLVGSRRQADGRWLLDGAHDEALAFRSFGESVGEPSRWNTLRALRVLRWYDGQARRSALLALSGVWRVHAERRDPPQLAPCLCRAGARVRRSV